MRRRWKLQSLLLLLLRFVRRRDTFLKHLPCQGSQFLLFPFQVWSYEVLLALEWGEPPLTERAALTRRNRHSNCRWQSCVASTWVSGAWTVCSCGRNQCGQPLLQLQHPLKILGKETFMGDHMLLGWIHPRMENSFLVGHKGRNRIFPYIFP